jgi:hypothetical protein
MIDLWETYVCDGCGKRESSDVGSPFSRVEDGDDVVELCDRCYDNFEPKTAEDDI